MANPVEAVLPAHLLSEPCTTQATFEEALEARTLKRKPSDGLGYLYTSLDSKAVYICKDDLVHSGIFYFGFPTEMEALSFYANLESSLDAEYGESNWNFKALPAKIYLWVEGDPDHNWYVQLWRLEDREIYLNVAPANYWDNEADLGDWIVNTNFGHPHLDVLCADYGRCKPPDYWKSIFVGLCNGLLFDLCD